MSNETQGAEKYKNMTLVGRGLKYDQPDCDWIDNTISHENDNLANYVGMACPQCGHDVLTDIDYQNATQLLEYAEFINSLSPEKLRLLEEEYGAIIPGMFKGEIDTVIFDTHEKISISDIVYKQKPEIIP
jgi:hypothetical protein